MSFCGDFLQLSATKEDLIAGVLSQKELLQNLSEYSQGTPLYEDSMDRRKSYMDSLRADKEEVADQIKHVLMDFAVKITSAPTSIHMRGTAVLLIPILNQLMEEYESVTAR